MNKEQMLHLYNIDSTMIDIYDCYLNNDLKNNCCEYIIQPNIKTYDNEILEQINNNPDSQILICWPTCNSYYLSIKNNIEKISKVYEKKITLSRKGVENLLCELYINTLLNIGTIEKRMKYINSKCSQYCISDENVITILLLDSKILLEPVLNYSYNLIKSDKPSTNITKQDLIYNVEKHYLVLETAQLLFHDQSLIFLESRKLENWLNEEFIYTFVKLNAVKKWQIDNNADILLFDEATMGTMGIRNINKIVGMMNEHIDTNIVYEELFFKETRIPFIKIGIPNTISWSESWSKYNKFINGNYTFYYWNGLRILSLDTAISLKLERYELTDYIDFKAIERIHHLKDFLIIKKENIKKGQHNDYANLLTRFMKNDVKLLLEY